jgi:hypothetical protein
MRTVSAPTGGSWWHRLAEEAEARVAIVAAVCLIVQAVIAKNGLEVELDGPVDLHRLPGQRPPRSRERGRVHRRDHLRHHCPARPVRHLSVAFEIPRVQAAGVW